MELNDFKSLVIEFDSETIGAEYLLSGWSGAEVNLRWAIGHEAQIRLPAIHIGCADLVLTVHAQAISIAGRLSQSVNVLVNDHRAREFEVRGSCELSLVLRREMFFFDKENVITFQFRHSASVGDLDSGDSRPLALAFKSIRLDAMKVPLYDLPVLLPRYVSTPNDKKQLKAIASLFQSLGQNCEFGLWQRQCGNEALGLLRFSSIVLNNVLHGIRTHFEGIDDPAKLSFTSGPPGSEYIGHHQIYGLDYHTFRNNDQIDYERFAGNESPRLKYLARMLMDQVKSAGKIFVIQRSEHPLTIDCVLPLFLALKAYNPEIKLLFLTAVGSDFPSLVGRIERLGDGLFHGYLRRFAPADNAPDLDFETWTQICAHIAEISVSEGWDLY